MSIFSERLISVRKSQNINQKQLAEILQVTPTRLNYWEKGKREPDISMIMNIAKALNISADYLIGLVDIPHQPNPERIILTKDENKLLRDYRQLNKEGKDKSREYTEDLTTIEKYTAADADLNSKIG